MPRIGRLTPVDLRQVWQSEPYSFTPWLAEPDNLQFLADSLDLPGLELVRTEHPVDSFSADIVAKIVDTDHFVLIENQLEKTDHLHLGQVLTYAPRFDAKIVVWIAREFTDAHRAALDWLNRITSEEYGFFGLEVRAVRIGGSEPAPLFDVIVKPNNWTRVAQPIARANTGVLEQGSSNERFWAAFHQKLTAAGGPVRLSTKPLRDTNYYCPLSGDGRAFISVWRSQSKKPNVGVFVGLYNEGARQAWEVLLPRQAELEAAFGEQLRWTSNNKETRFSVEAKPFYSQPDEENWPAQHEWLVERVLHTERVFKSSILDALASTDSHDGVYTGAASST